jgi:GT2 family glycosyltransferase
MGRNTQHTEVTFGIGIPTLNRYDLLLPALMMYAKDLPKINIYILDNGNQHILGDNKFFNHWLYSESWNPIMSNISVMQKEKNIGVGASWNVLCDKIFEQNDYALILNDDIYLGKREDEIKDLIKKKDCFLRSTIDWCAFILPKKIWQLVGKFDECFYPAYYEDKSYEYRMKLLGIYPAKTPTLNPYIYKSSQTLEKKPEILESSKRNKELYIKMWGGEPEREIYKKPYEL